MKSLDYKIEYLENAINRLNEALLIDSNNIEIKIDVCVKRFEFTYEQCKKTLISAVFLFGIDTLNINKVFQSASENKLISSVKLWDNMRNDRNNTSPEYNKEKAAEIYGRIPLYAKEFELVLQRTKEINKKYG